MSIDNSAQRRARVGRAVAAEILQLDTAASASTATGCGASSEHVGSSRKVLGLLVTVLTIVSDDEGMIDSVEGMNDLVDPI